MKLPLTTLIAMLIISTALGCSSMGERPVSRIETARGDIHYLGYAPTLAPRQRVILAHGFLRSPQTMDSTAQALADNGIECAVIDLKRSRFWAGNHSENALDMIALREALGWKEVTYAGFSAGGLSALLAASSDVTCNRLLMLDPVDSGSLGLHAAADVGVPTLAILGKPGSGNAWRNATAMLKEIPDCRQIELPEARHFDFESRGSTRSASICEAIHGFAAAWLLDTPLPQYSDERMKSDT